MATDARAVLRVLVAARSTFVQHRSVLDQAAVSKVLPQPSLFSKLLGVLANLVGTSEKDFLPAVSRKAATSTSSQRHLGPPRSTGVYWLRRRACFIRGATGHLGIRPLRRLRRQACFIRGATGNLGIRPLRRLRSAALAFAQVGIVRSQFLWCNAFW